MLHTRRCELTSTATLGATSCCTLKLYCQSRLRVPHPVRTAGLTAVVWLKEAQLRADHAPHSPLAAEFMKLQLATRSPLGSDHERLIEVTSVEPGLLIVYASPVHAPCRYSPTLTLSAVLPLPKRS